MNVIDELRQSHGTDIQDQLMNQLGLTRDQAASVLPKVGPLILGALKQQKDLHGDDQVHGHLEQLGGGADFSDIGAMLRNGADTNDPSLGGLLGAKGQQASDMMAQHLNISPGIASKIIPMLAPLIIGMLLKKRGGGSGAGGGGLGGLGSILDRDGDGQILDDIGGVIFGGGNTGGTPGGSTKSGCLSSILGGLLKGRR